MKKNLSKLLCVLLVVATLFCLNTAVFAEDTTESTHLNQILGPLGTSDLNGNLLIKDGTNMELEADFEDKTAVVAWDVLAGKDVISLSVNPNNSAKVLATPLANGTATIIAYCEDGSQVSATCTIIVSNMEEVQAAPVTLTTSVEGSGNIYRLSESGSSLPLGTSFINQFPVGSEIDLTAVESDQPFKYWAVRHGGDKDVIVSTEKNYKFTMGTDMTVVAVFDKTDGGTAFGTGATFICNNIVAGNMYVKSLAKNAPDAVYQRNKQFDKWTSEQVDASAVLADKKLSSTELNGATTFEANYTTKTVENEITVIGGSGSGIYAYGAPVSVNLTAEAQSGKQFLFWSKDGAPVSYDQAYAFSAMQDCTVSAVFGSAVATDGINMVMQAPVVEGNAIAFTFERYVPESYNFISSGFVVSKMSDCTLGSSANLMEVVSYRTGKRTQLTKSLNKVSGVTTYYARGYVIYKDGDTVKTIYTEPQKITLQ